MAELVEVAGGWHDNRKEFTNNNPHRNNIQSFPSHFPVSPQAHQNTGNSVQDHRQKASPPALRIGQPLAVNGSTRPQLQRSEVD